MTAVRASSGLPGLFSPTWHAGRWLIDGGHALVDEVASQLEPISAQLNPP